MPVQGCLRQLEAPLSVHVVTAQSGHLARAPVSCANRTGCLRQPAPSRVQVVSANPDPSDDSQEISDTVELRAGSCARLTEELEKSGRPMATRTPDLYRVKRQLTNTLDNLDDDGDRVSTWKYV